MLVGQLDQSIGLYSLTVVNNLGQNEETYALDSTVFGYVTASRGTEALESARVNSREMIRVKIRYNADITNKWQITWAGQTYNVRGIDRIGRRQGEMWLSCEAVGAE